MRITARRVGLLTLLFAVGCSSSGSSAGGDAGTLDAAPIPPDELSFTPRRGFFDAPVEIALTSDIAHDEIRYTTDGSRPTVDHGLVYESPILVDETTHIRAVLVLGGESVSPVRTHSYLFPDSVFSQGDLRPDGPYVFWTTEMDPEVIGSPAYSDSLRSALFSIPTMSVVGDPETLFGVSGIHRGNNLMAGSGGRAGDAPHPEWVDEVEASIELIYPEDYARGPFRGFQVNAGLKTQGGGGRWDNGTYDHKQSFGLRFRSAYGTPTLRYPVFEDAPLHAQGESAKYDKLILRAGHNKSWGATWDNARSAYTRDQLGRDLQLAASNLGARGTFVHLFLNGQYWGLYNLTERPDDAHAARYLGGEEEEWYAGKAKGGDVDGDNSRFRSWREDIADTDDWTELQQYLAVDAYIDMCLLNVYAATGDFPQYYFVNRNAPAPGPIYFFAWDTEDAYDGGSKRTGAPNVDRFDGCYEFYAMWDATEEFRARLAERAQALAAGALSDAQVIAAWDTLNAYIEEAMILESARWGDERIDDTGVRYTRDEHWQDARDRVREDLSGRSAQFLDALRNASRGGIPYLP